ncbi:LOW QUALITY PROTEIN: hypothetical protein NC653_005117 [Populus alba x Populus x berolinensis]|uniref:Neutral/alkaline non-lysosomal ceramidase N-terminal domain-containing protein n=1 Tax=Populus alba x Populus x berolinensis TaxID=444605 RepID=A0AAD6RCF5_9ROSI|nr:LOW QUALITY PROTEIN: hypothetical protein NC653_005117 [Populus alba x Populus x berolinensis]
MKKGKTASDISLISCDLHERWLQGPYSGSTGFVQQSFDALVNAIEQSAVQAHENLKPGSVFINTGDVENAGINRSPSAYLLNPAEERARYPADVDKEMTLLKFIVLVVIKSIGAFSWYATHGTSMSRDNKLISGDNKGAAARFFEDWLTSTESNSSRSVPTPSTPGPGFAAGTTDGPGMFGFQQGDTEINELWKKVRDLLKEPSQFQVECQKPKAVLRSNPTNIVQIEGQTPR